MVVEAFIFRFRSLESGPCEPREEVGFGAVRAAMAAVLSGSGAGYFFAGAVGFGFSRYFASCSVLTPHCAAMSAAAPVTATTAAGCSFTSAAGTSFGATSRNAVRAGTVWVFAQ